jgi:transcriptional regulator with XRE-family HTH domain
MGIRVNQPRLKCEMARRGWTRKKLARAAGLSASTVNAAMNGTPIHPTSLHQIAIALDKAAPVEGIDPLIDD